MMATNKEQISQVYECVKTFHNLEVLPCTLPKPQHINLLPKLRPYQVKAVNWMLSKEIFPSYYHNSPTSNNENGSDVLLPKGGILAEEMGLGKTVEVLACILSNPRNVDGKSSSLQPLINNSGTSISEENEKETIIRTNLGDELHPTHDGTLEIKNAVIKGEDDTYGVNNLYDSACVMDCSTREATEVSIQNRDLKQEECVDSKIKQRKKVTFDTANETIEIQSVEMDDNTNSGNNMNDSACVMDLSRQDADIEDMESQQDHSVKRRSKQRKRVDTSTSDYPTSKKRKLNNNLPEEPKSSFDVTIDEVIVNYCYNGVAPQPRPKRAAALKSQNRTLLQAWYESCLSESSVRSERAKRFQCQSTFQCCCVKDVTSDDVVECPTCKTWQHAQCVGYDETTADYQYYCFRCWRDQPPVTSAGTVIISPEAISQQWLSEIGKHISKDTNWKVLVYEGVRINGYIQPYDLASYDIVITTYEVLTKELNYTEPVERNLRHAKRFFAPTSPLLCVQWWRLCLDEAQMVEGSSCRAAEMAKKFSAVNKWAVTGTPIQKAINDLVGLMEFLAGSDCPEFLALMGSGWCSLLKLVPRVLWRTQMKDVLAETGVPPQTVETHLLDFSKIEKYFYECTHAECSQQFVNRIQRFQDLTITLKSLDRKAISNLLNPLLKLRQACLHPQAVRGKFLTFKKTMTMDDLMASMVTNAKLDAEQALRQLVASLNGTGALYIIRQEWAQAAAAYRGVLHLEHEHKDLLKIDSLQKIHAMHNLAEVLDGGYDGIPPTLRDSTLREDIKGLELRYLGKREAPIKVSEEKVLEHAQAVSSHLQDGTVLDCSDWWMRLMEWSLDRDELFDRLKASISKTDVHQTNHYNQLVNKLSSLYIVRLEIAKWLSDIDKTRKQVCQWVQELRAADNDEMAAEALICHLPQGRNTKKRTRCKVCQAENVLKAYESLLFEEKIRIFEEKRQKNKRNSLARSEDTDNKEIRDLIDIKIFESSKKGGFKASPMEKILRALAAYGRQKHAPANWMKDSSQLFTLLDRLKKEFLELNLMWRQMSDYVDAKDELNMCKTRLRLPYLEEEEDLESKKKKKKIDDQHIISLYRVEPELHKLETEKAQYEALLKKKTGILCYLKNLQTDGTPAAICPICHGDLTDKWAVLKCGHCICLECLSQILKPQCVAVPCPQCRQHCNIHDVSYVENQPRAQATEVKGSHSTKVTAVIQHTLRLIQQQPDVKILVFSAWERVLGLLAEGFNENNITFKQMKSGKAIKRQAIKEFKTGDVSVLLLPLRSGAKGLNLVEATHVFLVEPILNPAEELQAVGRVHRIGQTRPTVVHRFIVRETIEERILAAVAASAAEQWSHDCVTLQQLFDLFTSDLDLSLVQSQEGPSVSVVESDSEEDEAGASAEPESDSDIDL